MAFASSGGKVGLGVQVFVGASVVIRTSVSVGVRVDVSVVVGVVGRYSVELGKNIGVCDGVTSLEVSIGNTVPD